MNTRLVPRFAGLAAIASLATALAFSPELPAQGMGAQPQMTVFKDPNCGCCKLWVDHLRKHAFSVTTKDTSDVQSIKGSARVPEAHRSCHTAFVGGYVIEGHVPAEDIKRLLAEKPKIAGLAVGGMPVGSPGMEFGNRKDPYDVVAFNRDGTTRVFAKH
jgi:hypothetical protein